MWLLHRLASEEDGEGCGVVSVGILQRGSAEALVGPRRADFGGVVRYVHVAIGGRGDGAIGACG